MSDDEEVVLPSSELNKLLADMNISGYEISNNVECSNSVSKMFSNIQQSSVKAESMNIVLKRPGLSPNIINIIRRIVKTGLLYPDHVANIEMNIDLEENIKNTFYSKSNVAAYACMLTSALPVVFVRKPYGIQVLSASLLAGCFIFSYKLYNDFSYSRQKIIVDKFIFSIEQLFSVTKKSLAFISESEFLLKTKMMKNQQFYVPNGLWVNSNSKEGIESSGLLWPQFRNVLIDVFLYFSRTFYNLISSSRKCLRVLAEIDNDSYYTEPPDENALNEICADASIENLKKLNSMYLISQSEFLRLLAFSFIQDFWIKKEFRNNLTSILKSINELTDNILCRVNILEYNYNRCLKINEYRDVQVERNKVLRAEKSKDKVFIFTKNFLTKADAHLSSLNMDLKMLYSWLNYCERNFDEDDCTVNELVAILHNKLVLMSSNADLFTSFYNDNCNILKKMTCQEPIEKSISTLISNEKSGDVQITGIEVGKSDFKINGEDQVLISLSNFEPSNNISGADTIDNYEECEVKKFLPKNVLMELKCALKPKKDEWIEREKRALKLDEKFENSDLETSLNGDWDNTSNTLTCPKSNSIDKSDSEYYSDVDDNDSASGYKAIVSSTVRDENSFVEFPDEEQELNYGNVSEFSNRQSLYYSMNDPQNSSSGGENSFCSFLNQIKSTQKSFNLGNTMKEEEFFDDLSSIGSDG